MPQIISSRLTSLPLFQQYDRITRRYGRRLAALLGPVIEHDSQSRHKDFNTTSSIIHMTGHQVQRRTTAEACQYQIDFALCDITVKTSHFSLWMQKKIIQIAVKFFVTMTRLSGKTILIMASKNLAQVTGRRRLQRENKSLFLSAFYTT